jgi:SHAQKYF class myb-like DNA-binding protein
MSDEVDVDLYYDEMPAALMGNAGIPFQMNFDEVNIHRVDSATSVTSSANYPAGKKRAVSDTFSDSSKRRVVWPDALHRDFMAAVFDIGLQHANPKEILSLMGPIDVPATPEQIRSTTSKFATFRERKYGEYMSFTERARYGHDSQPVPTTTRTTLDTSDDCDATDLGQLASYLGLFQGNSFNSLDDDAEDSDMLVQDQHSGYIQGGYSDQHMGAHYPSIPQVAPGQAEPAAPEQPVVAGNVAAATALLEQIEAVTESIKAQGEHIAHLKQLLRKQIKIHAVLTQKATEIRALLPAGERAKRPFNPFLAKNIRNTCSTLYKMNIITGDVKYGLSYVDATEPETLYNDGFNYNYTNNAGEEGVSLLTYLRNTKLSANTGSGASQCGSASGGHQHGVCLQAEKSGALVSPTEMTALPDCTVYLPGAYKSEEACVSGYNSFMDHAGYKYTAEDNRLCHEDGSKYRSSAAEPTTAGVVSGSDTSYGTESSCATDEVPTTSR